ncbi:MAG: Gfo/Idh/MocA family oxidoreductase [Sphaerochaeta sp.]|nr:Gfo/Idh/MocA family oxidoreductase [Sphaerochaeta sp.]
MAKHAIIIIGTGAIARVHIEAYKSMDDCKIVGLCDLFVEKAESLITEMDLVGAVACRDYKEALATCDADIVSVCLPPGLHAQVAIDALNAGKHVLVEKPMATSLEECDLMIEAATRGGKLLSIVCQNRFKTPMMKMKQLLDSSQIGAIRFANVNSYWWRGQSYYDLWWRGTWENESGGCTAGHATHHIDLMQWFLGMPSEVTAVISNMVHTNSECEDLSVAIFRYPEKMALLTATLLMHGEEQSMTFSGDKAKVSIPWSVHANKELENGFPVEDVQTQDSVGGYYDALPEMDIEGHPAQIRNFIRAIGGEEELLVTGEQGRNTIELIMAIYKSSVKEGPVRLPLARDDLFYTKAGLVSQMPKFFEKKRSVKNFSTDKISLGRDVGK